MPTSAVRAIDADEILAQQAAIVRRLGSPLVAAILEAGQRQLHRAPDIATMIADWPGDAADAALATDTPFIPIARPLRWSLVAMRLRQWRPNTRAWHPLNRLRDDTN